MKLIDAHAHLERVPGVESALDEARGQGVCAVIAVGMDSRSNRATLELAERYPSYVYPCAGYHPWEIKAEKVEEEIRAVEHSLSRCVALGEVGLDFGVKVPKALQKEVFARLLALAAALDKPVIVHARYSHQRTLEAVVEQGVSRAVFHWYSGPLDTLKALLDRGYCISATPALAYSPPHQEAVRYAPTEQLLVETDCPVSYQGQESRPADVRKTVEQAASLKKMAAEALAQIVFRTTMDFFRLPETP